MSVGNHISHISFGLLICLIMGCASSGNPGYEKKTREVHLKVVVDSEFSSDVAWESNIRKLIRTASKFYESWADVTFVIDTLFLLREMEGVNCDDLFPEDCLQARIPQGESDAVLHFSRENLPDRLHYLGISLFEDGYIRVVQMGWHTAFEPYKMAYFTLIHEFGHFFGAMHVFPYHRTKDIMEPSHDNNDLIQKTGKSMELYMPDFGYGNADIVALMAKRPFHDSGWGKVRLERIIKAYDKVRNTYNPSKIGADLRLEGFETDAYYQQDRYFFLSIWASLSGKDSTALVYLDSASIMSRAVVRRCETEKATSPSRLCRYNFKPAQSFLYYTYHWQKAKLLLRAGRHAEADATFKRFLEDAVLMSAPEKIKFRNGYNMRKAQFSQSPSNRIQNRTGSDDMN